MAVEARREDQGALADVNCDRLKRYNPAEYSRLERAATVTAAEDKKQTAWIKAPIGEKMDRIVYWYNDRLLNYFKQPPAAQTFFVTLLMGALGGLTVNVLRLRSEEHT